MPRPADDLILRHFGLRENPFGVTPDPRFLFLTHTHREALASLVDGIECGFGFQVLVAQPGMGKTTLLFDLLERFRSSRTAFLFQQQHESREFLRSDSEETSRAKLYGHLNHLLSKAALTQKRVIVVVDEAHDLEDSLLETLRRYLNFETTRLKLLQIVLAGQPQLARRLARPEQEHLRQRISTIAQLSPLGLNETLTYLSHRLNVAGYRGPELFTAAACQSIWSRSQGIPRNINTLCFNAMLLAFAQGAKQVDERAVQEAAQDLDFDYVLAHVVAIREPAVGVKDRNLTSRIVPGEQKPDHNQQPVGARVSFDDAPRPMTESDLGSAAVSIANPNLTSGIVLSGQKPSHNQQPAGLQSSSDNAPGSFIAEPFVAESGHGSNTGWRRKFVMGLLVAAAVGGGVLFGGLGTRRRQAEERPGSFVVQQAQEQPPVLEAPFITQPHDNNEPRPVVNDDSREVVVRNFPRAGDDSAEATILTLPPAVPSASSSTALHTENVFFDVDSAVVSSRYVATLQRIAEILAANSQSNAIIEGHTDSSGEESYNSQLSNRRAIAVKDVLVNEYHIPASRLNTVGVGSSAPLESNLTGIGRAYNRRVEIRMTQPGG